MGSQSAEAGHGFLVFLIHRLHRHVTAFYEIAVAFWWPTRTICKCSYFGTTRLTPRTTSSSSIMGLLEATQNLVHY